MPELPDVELFRRGIEGYALHRPIVGLSLPNPELLDGISAAELRRRLEGRRFVSTRRHGKHLLLQVEGDGWLTLHFGMSGYPRFSAKGLPLPPYTRMAIGFAEGEFAFVVPRKIGRIALVERPEQLIEERRLGIDALDPRLDRALFEDLARGNGMIKCRLMEQSIIAGIGNEYSDEILFQARLDPRRQAGAIAGAEMERLYRAMKRVLREAIERGAEPRRLPDEWLLPHRREGSNCPACGGKVLRLRLCGRSAYLCPACQR